MRPVPLCTCSLWPITIHLHPRVHTMQYLGRPILFLSGFHFTMYRVRTTLIVPRSSPLSASAPGHNWRVRRLFHYSPRAELHGPDAKTSASQCEPGPWSHAQPNCTRPFGADPLTLTYAPCYYLHYTTTAPLQGHVPLCARGAIEVKPYKVTYCFATHTPSWPTLSSLSLVLTKPGATLIFPAAIQNTLSLFVPLRQLSRMQ